MSAKPRGRVRRLVGHILVSPLLGAHNNPDSMNQNSHKPQHNAPETKTQTSTYIDAKIFANGCGMILLQRPKALNSLNLEMVLTIIDVLTQWRKNKKVKFILFLGKGRAFCAGGDIRSLAHPPYPSLPQDFFRQEYTMDHMIHFYNKPVVSILAGIVMGGGVGISRHGAYRIITDNTLFAMPETGIGLFPDIGSTYFLPKFPGRIGWYLALTGARLKNKADILYVSFGTHYVRQAQLARLVEQLQQTSINSNMKVTAWLNSVINAFHTKTAPSPLSKERNHIDNCFRGSSVEDVVKNLTTHNTPWSKRIIQLLSKRSPTSLKIAFHALHLSRSLSLPLSAALKMEYRIGVRCAPSHDFLEGVRAMTEKDKPKWKPNKLSLVKKSYIVKHYFAPFSKSEMCTELELKDL